MTVYLVHPVDEHVNTADAVRFGDIETINSRYIFVDEMGEQGVMPPEFVKHIVHCADRFNPAKDFVFIAGDHLQLITLAAKLGERYTYFKVLRWDRQLRQYFVARVQV